MLKRINIFRESYLISSILILKSINKSKRKAKKKTNHNDLPQLIIIITLERGTKIHMKKGKKKRKKTPKRNAILYRVYFVSFKFIIFYSLSFSSSSIFHLFVSFVLSHCCFLIFGVCSVFLFQILCDFDSDFSSFHLNVCINCYNAFTRQMFVIHKGPADLAIDR